MIFKYLKLSIFIISFFYIPIANGQMVEPRTEKFIIDSILNIQKHYTKTNKVDTILTIDKNHYSNFTIKRNKQSIIYNFKWNIPDYDQNVECFVFNGELKKITITSIKYPDFRDQYYFKDNEIVANRWSTICRLNLLKEIERFKNSDLVNYTFILKNIYKYKD